MGIKYSFVDNATYGTEDINEIAACLTGAGIAPFASKDSYNVSDLNAVTAALVESGVSLDGCKCTVQNAGTTEMRVNVAQGIIFFESGVRLIVDSNGYSVAAEPNTAGYVFAHYNPSLQIADIKFDTELQTDGECVELARVTAGGVLKDRRSFADSKIATLGKNAKYSGALTGTEAIHPEEVYYSYQHGKVYIVAKLEGVDLSRFNYAYVYNSRIGVGGILDINQNNLEFCGSEDVYARCSSSYQILARLNSYLDAYIRVIDGELCLLFDTSRDINSYITDNNISFAVTLC